MSRFGPPVVRLHGGKLDLESREGEREGASFQLSPVEADVVGYLVAAGRPISEEELLAQVWGYHPSARSATAKVTIARLRKKLEADPARPQHILTEKGLGYRWDGPSSPRPRRYLDSFVGRAAEAARFQGLVDAPLVTLVGEGGIGKTRLAHELVAELPHLVVPLAGVRTVEGVLPAIAAAGAMVRVPDVAAMGQDLLRSGVPRLLLDNLEHLLPAVAGTVQALLAHAPGLRVLATSRVALGVPGEVRIEVPPLAPDDARRLFCARCPIEVQDAPELDALVLLLEGRPLDLELAAGRASTLSVPQLLLRLRRPLDTLARPHGSGREGSVRESIRWSWDLLAPPEREALLALRTFESPFQVDAAEHVLGPGGLDPLQLLVERSWLRRRVDGRLGLVEAVRQFLAEEAPEGPAARTRDAHLAWFARFGAAEVRAHLDHDNGAARRALAAELPDLVAATQWALASGQAEAGALTLMAGLAGAELGLPRDLLLSLAAAFEGKLPPPLEAELAGEVGEALCAVDRFPEGRAACARALALARAHGCWYPFTRSALREAGTRFALGEVDAARALIDETLALLRDIDAPALHAMAWAKLGGLLLYRNDFEGARRAARITRAAATRGKMPRMLGAAALSEARAAISLGEGEAAERALLEAREQMTLAGHAPMIAIIEAELSCLLRVAGRFGEALACLDRGGAIWARVGRPQIALSLLGLRAEVLRRAGDLDGARAVVAQIHATPHGFAGMPPTEQPEMYALRAELEDPPEAALAAVRAAEAQALAQAHHGAHLQCVGRRVRLLVRLGRVAEAEALYRELLTQRDAQGWGRAANGVSEAVDEARAALGAAI